jgi:uncharacterized membrane protein YjgN (DUF898 family)
MLSSLAVDNTSDITESSDDAAKSIQDILQLLSTLTVLGGIILATVVGNAFVIAAVVLERNLRTHVANYLVASLAVADLMVAALVMPVAAVKDVSVTHVRIYTVTSQLSVAGRFMEYSLTLYHERYVYLVVLSMTLISNG